MINKFISRPVLATCACIALTDNAFGQFDYITNAEENSIVADSTGIYSTSSNFNIKNLFTKNIWTGDWIWLNKLIFKDYQETQTEWAKNPNYHKQYKALFRKNFNLVQIPNHVIISLTADISYRLYINGVFVNQGPPDIGNDYFDGVPPEHWFYSTLDVMKYLHEGINTIAIEVYSHFREISETSSGEGMLICDLDTGLNENIVGTDTSWKCNIDTSFTVNAGQYALNSNLESINWMANTFDDALWEKSSIREFSKEGYLVDSKIPVPFRYPVKPIGVWFPRDDNVIKDYGPAVFNRTFRKTEFTLDYGKNLTGYYGFEILAHKNDTLKIYPYEKKYTSQNRPINFVCKEGLNVFEAPFMSVYRYLKVEIVSEKGLVIKDVHTYFSSYPVNYVGSFACSDSMLTELWNITRWTTQLCMNDMFYDSPKHQEPIACTGDYLIQSLINYYAFGDPWLTRQTLIKTALLLEKNKYDMFHTSYSLLWVQMLYYYYQYTGDIQLVKNLLPNVNKLNELFETYLDNDYLVSNAPDYMFMDWIKIDKFNAHHPPAVVGMGYMTAFYYKSLLDAAYLNVLFDNISVRDKNLELAQKIKTAMNNLLWDGEKNLYKDGIPFRSNSANHSFFPKDENIVTYSPHVNTLAVLYDIAPKNQQSAIMDYVVNQKSIDLQPYFMFYVLDAVDHLGQFSTMGFKLLKKWEKGINKETYTLKENWQDMTETGYGGDYSHAWGGSPLYFMSKNILGVKPRSPGYKEIELRPFLSESIHWAKGRVPLVGGNSIEVCWSNKTNSIYRYHVEIPQDNKVILQIPDKLRNKDFTINNKPYSKTLHSLELVGGKYEIVFRR